MTTKKLISCPPAPVRSIDFLEDGKQRILRGEQKTRNAYEHMPGIRNFIKKYAHTSYFKDKNILGCFTVTPETAVFILALKELGVHSLRWCSDNATHSDPDVVAFLQASQLAVFAGSDMSQQEYKDCMDKALMFTPQQKQKGIYIVDDGCDITSHIVDKHPGFLKYVDRIQENTTCGIGFLKNLYKANRLPVPAFNVNDCITKSYFDNQYGVSSSFVDSFKTITSESFHDRDVAVFGYGPVGRGAANLLKKEGARVSIVEADILKLMQAQFDGFTPKGKREALAESDICVTATGCCDVIDPSDFVHARDGATFCNIGQNNNEFDYAYLKDHLPMKSVSDHIELFDLPNGRTIRALCHGSLVNFLNGKGNPPEIMSLTFTMHLLAMVADRDSGNVLRAPQVHAIPAHYEFENATLNFPDLAAKKTKLTPNQAAYLGH